MHPPFPTRAKEKAPAFTAGRCPTVVLVGSRSTTPNAISSLALLFLQHIDAMPGTAWDIRPHRCIGQTAAVYSHLAERLRSADDRIRAERTAPAHRRLQEEEID
jgi:hypothetical protein